MQRKPNTDHIVINIDKLTKSYHSTKGIKDISLTVYRGDIFGFLGPNGAGKTTTIRSILGYLKPDYGQIKILNVPNNSREIKHKIGYLPGDVFLFKNFNGEQLLNHLASFYPSNLVNWDYVDQLAELFQLDLKKKISKYSFGMRQKLGIICTFIADPEIVFLDEPTLGLDPIIKVRFYKFLKKYKSRGKTVFISTHILSDVERLCNRVAIIRNGEIVAVEEIGKLKDMGLRKIKLQFSNKSKVQFRINFPIIEGMQKVNYDKTTNFLQFYINVRNLALFFEALRDFKVIDCTIEVPPLEEVFLDYYND